MPILSKWAKHSFHFNFENAMLAYLKIISPSFWLVLLRTHYSKVMFYRNMKNEDFSPLNSISLQSGMTWTCVMGYGSRCRWASKFLTDAYLLQTRSLVESLHLIARAIEASLRSRFCCCAISIQIYPERSFQVHRADKSRLLVKTRLSILQMEWPFFSPYSESVSQKQRSVSCLKRIKSML